jgi:hypothetical protein
MTADLVLLFRRTSSRKARPDSRSSRIVTVSPMSYIVRHQPVCVKLKCCDLNFQPYPKGEANTQPAFS